MSEPAYLRALEPEDLERTQRWHNSAELYGTLGAPHRYVSRAAEKSWLEQQCKFSDKDVSLAVCEVKTNEHVGNIYLRNIDWVSRTGELHLFIGDAEHRGKGLGRAAMRQLLEYAFDTLNLWKIHLRVLGTNGAAIKLYEGCGFRGEGVLKEHVFKNGEYQDLVLMGLTKKRYQELCQN